jgi:hypothetical protein
MLVFGSKMGVGVLKKLKKRKKNDKKFEKSGKKRGKREKLKKKTQKAHSFLNSCIGVKIGKFLRGKIQVSK